MSSEWTLAIDVGTSRTAGAIATPGAAATPLEVEGNRWMSSTVAVDDQGQLVVGRAAASIAAARPDRAERSPKRSVGAPVPMVLGERAVEPAEAFAALMRVVADEGLRRFDGSAPAALVLTHPVRWEELRQAVLIEAAGLADLPEPTLVPEPVAAAHHYAAGDLEVGATIAVYDLGGGTFDTVVMRREADTFEVLGPPGGDESIGGDHFDHLVFLHLGQMLAAEDPEVWQQLQVSTERQWMRAAHDLLEEARQVKETLSLYPSTQIYVPVADRELLITREELEGLLDGPITRSIDELLDTVDDAGIDPDALDAVYLVGGSSRIPMVAERLEAEFGLKVRTRDEPKSVVVEGAAALGSRSAATVPTWSSEREPVAVAGTEALHGDDELLVICAADELTLVGPASTSPIRPEAPTSHQCAARNRVVLRMGPASVSSWDQNGQQWSADITSSIVAGPVMAGDAAVVATDDGTVVALDRRGAQTWRADLALEVTGLTATASVVIASTTAGRLVSIDAMSGSIRWLYPMRAPLEHAVCLTGSLVHAASSDGILYTLDVGTGRPRWAFQLDQTPTVHPVAVGTSLVALATSGLIGLDRSSGEQLWVAELDHPVERLRGGRSHGVASNPTGIQMLDAFGALTAVPGAVDAIQVGDHVAIAATDRVVWWTPETRNNAPG